ncbi:MAG: hypothetical protein IK131_12905 [Paludibacteraceae bacterium]|nr:hypothetical protein [Paludibacteraceae bacterium]
MNGREIIYNAVKAVPYATLFVVSSSILLLETERKGYHCLPISFMIIPVLLLISPIFWFILKKYPVIPGVIWGIVVPLLAKDLSDSGGIIWLLFPLGVGLITYFYHKKMYDEKVNKEQALAISWILFFLIIIATVAYFAIRFGD